MPSPITINIAACNIRLWRPDTAEEGWVEKTQVATSWTGSTQTSTTWTERSQNATAWTERTQN